MKQIVLSQPIQFSQADAYPLAGATVTLLDRNEREVLVVAPSGERHWVSINDVAVWDVAAHQVADAYDDLIEATHLHGERLVEYIRAKEEHDRAYQIALYQGIIDGKNEDTRMGMFREEYSGLAEQLFATREALTHMESEREIARLKLERAKMVYVSSQEAG